MSDPTALYEEKAELLKALAHPLRLRIVRGLVKCGCNEVYYEIANPEVAAVLSALFGDREEEYQCMISR